MEELLSFVLSGKIRVKVLQALLKIEKTPTLLAKEINTHQSTTSRTLKDLEEKELVVCLTPNSKLSRLYSITEKGKIIIIKINKII